jgi:hypothetical protein
MTKACQIVIWSSSCKLTRFQAQEELLCRLALIRTTPTAADHAQRVRTLRRKTQATGKHAWETVSLTLRMRAKTGVSQCTGKTKTASECLRCSTCLVPRRLSCFRLISASVYSIRVYATQSSDIKQVPLQYVYVYGHAASETDNGRSEK